MKYCNIKTIILKKAPTYHIIFFLILITGLVGGCANKMLNNPPENTNTLIKPDHYITLKQINATKKKINQIDQLPTEEAVKYSSFLDQLDSSSLPEIWQNKVTLKKSEIALYQDNPQQALFLLTQPALVNNDTSTIKLKRLILTAYAYQQLHRYSASLYEWLDAIPLMNQKQNTLYSKNIWEVITQNSKTQLETLKTHTSNPISQGWLQLALLYEPLSTQITTQINKLNSWINNWPTHPGNAIVEPILDQLNQLIPNNIERIGIILPNTGELANYGQTISTGLVAAYFNLPNNQRSNTKLSFCNLGQFTVTQCYQNMLKQKVQVIIGPLSKSNVLLLAQHINQLHNKKSPYVITLNYIEPNQIKQLPPKFYQLGLSPKDEIIKLANTAWCKGYRNAITITYDTNWANDASNIFKKYWLKLGGTIVATSSFQEGTSFVKMIGKLLLVNDSAQRAHTLENILNTQLQYKIRPRQDVDMIMLIATPTQAKQIKPAFNYQFAGQIPIYATESSLPNNLNSISNEDMDGITLPAIPFVYANKNYSQYQKDWQQTQNIIGEKNLFALGVDALHAAININTLTHLPNIVNSGLTGQLTIDDNNIFHRNVPLYYFKNGQLTPYKGAETCQKVGN